MDAAWQLEHHGYCVLPGIIPSEALPGLLAAAMAAHDANQASAAYEQSERTRGHRVGTAGVTNLGQLVNHEQEVFNAVLGHPALTALLDAVFGGPEAFVRCNHASLLVNHPGCGRGYLHADWPYNATNGAHIPPPYPDATLALSSLWMLTDFTVENGGTAIVPGSHRTLDNPADGHLKPEIDQDGPFPSEVQVEGSAGSVLLWDSRLWHRVVSNSSSEARIAVSVGFSPWWLSLAPKQEGTADNTVMIKERNAKKNEVAPITHQAFENLEASVRRFFQHHIEQPAASL